jgi:protein-S-isoprenylcysteine O-methyltransferase Ste14
MKLPPFFVLVIICIITHVIRSAYEILKHKKILEPTTQSFIIVFTNMALLWVSWFALCAVDEYKVILPLIINWLGLIIVLSGLIVFLTALFTIKTLETYTGDLIVSGIYSKLRHPMYLGFILWSFGMPLFYGAYFSFLLSILFITNILFWRHLEELDLVKRFPGYLEYKSKTLF